MEWVPTIYLRRKMRKRDIFLFASYIAANSNGHEHYTCTTDMATTSKQYCLTLQVKQGYLKISRMEQKIWIFSAGQPSSGSILCFMWSLHRCLKTGECVYQKAFCLMNEVIFTFFNVNSNCQSILIILTRLLCNIGEKQTHLNTFILGRTLWSCGFMHLYKLGRSRVRILPSANFFFAFDIDQAWLNTKSSVQCSNRHSSKLNNSWLNTKIVHAMFELSWREGRRRRRYNLEYRPQGCGAI